MDQEAPEKRIAKVDTLAGLDARRPKGRMLWITRLRNMVIAVCVLLSAASAGCTTTGHPSSHDVQVPDVTGQSSADAIAALQNLGLVTHTQQEPDSSVPPGHVINTDPKANTTVGKGSAVTVNVSTGPEQR